MRKALSVFAIVIVGLYVFGLTLEVFERAEFRFLYPVDALKFSPASTDTQKADFVDLTTANVLRVKLKDGRLRYVTLADVVSPRGKGTKKSAEPFGVAAAVFGKLLFSKDGSILLEFLEGDKARIWFIAKRNGGKESAWISYGLALVSNGFARCESGDTTDELTKLLKESERVAKESKLGMWGETAELELIWELLAETWPPSHVRSDEKTSEVQNGPVKIVGIRATTKDEYVVIANVGVQPVNLEGWTLWSGGNQRFSFPAIVLQPGEKLEIHSGPAAAKGLIWTRRYVWKDSGDEARLYNDRGTLVSVYRY